MKKRTCDTPKQYERVSSTYAEIYFKDEHCDHETKKHEPEAPKILKKKRSSVDELRLRDDWKSPSDLLIGIISLTPPFTSKITRGTTHEGILSIGNGVLLNERARLEAELACLLQDNEAAWYNVLLYEKNQVSIKVKAKFQDIFKEKSETMAKEMSFFYEDSLQQLEDHMRDEIKHVLLSTHANIVSDLNTEIKKRLNNAKKALEAKLEQRFRSEITKIRHYYKLLLDNEEYRVNKLINRALYERNDALNAFYKLIEAETITSTMYVLSMERKKCKIKRFFLDNYQAADVKEKEELLKKKQAVLDEYQQKERHVSDINYEWEIKTKKIIQLFLKFISYSLKLLPEQTTYLLDLEKMFVLQLNEIQKQPMVPVNILKEDTDIRNTLKFEQADVPKPPCDKEPFEILGYTGDTVPPSCDSRETLASDVDLPLIRVQREFLYAKCHKYEAIKEFLDRQRCKCHAHPSPEPEPQPKPTCICFDDSLMLKGTSVKSESSDDPMPEEDIQRSDYCPAWHCLNLPARHSFESFPYLNSYLDFTEKNYETVKTFFKIPPVADPPPELVNPKDIAQMRLPFAATTERYHHVGTQYSSRENLDSPELENCTCADSPVQQGSSHGAESRSKLIGQALANRRNSLITILNQHPKLLKMFTDESFDFVL